MRKCILLLPLRYNDGSEVPSHVISGILREIDEAFDGHTIAGKAEGTYRMADGSMVTDPSLMVWVAVDSNEIDVLRAMVGRMARTLKQEAMYFEVTDAAVELIRPGEEGEGE